MEVWIFEAHHPNIPGRLFSVHATLEGAVAAALQSLNMIRKDLGLPPAEKFTPWAVLDTDAACWERYKEGCDVSVLEYKVLA